MKKYQDIQIRVLQCNLDLKKYGLAFFTFGNASAIDRQQGIVAIKPSGVSYEVLKPEDIVILDVEGKVIEGKLKPSSDTKTHLVLYHHFPDIGGVVHTHSTYAVAWAQAGKSIPVLGTTHADYAHVNIPCTDFLSETQIKGDYETETGNQIVKCFQNLSYQEVEMVLVAGHGPFTWGKTAEQAVHHSVILEELAKLAYLTQQINPRQKRLSRALIAKHFQRKHGSQAYYGQF